MAHCIYRGCDQYRVPLSSIAYFTLPANPARRQLWVERCGHPWDPDSWLRSRGHCCERHFEEAHIRRQFYRKTLRHDALPRQWHASGAEEEAATEVNSRSMAETPRLRKLQIIAPPLATTPQPAEEEVIADGEVEVLDYDEYLMSDAEQLSDSPDIAIEGVMSKEPEPEAEQQPHQPAEQDNVEELDYYAEQVEVYEDYIEEHEVQQQEQEQLVEVYDPAESDPVQEPEQDVAQLTRLIQPAEEAATAADSTDQMRCDTTTRERDAVPEPEPAPEPIVEYSCAKALERRQLKRKRLQAETRRNQQQKRARQENSKVQKQRQAVESVAAVDEPVAAAAQPEPQLAPVAPAYGAPTVAHLPPIAPEDAEDTYFALSLVGFLKRLQPQQRAMAKMNVIRYLTEMAFTGGQASL